MGKSAVRRCSGRKSSAFRRAFARTYFPAQAPIKAALHGCRACLRPQGTAGESGRHFRRCFSAVPPKAGTDRLYPIAEKLSTREALPRQSGLPCGRPPHSGPAAAPAGRPPRPDPRAARRTRSPAPGIPVSHGNPRPILWRLQKAEEPAPACSRTAGSPAAPGKLPLRPTSSRRAPILPGHPDPPRAPRQAGKSSPPAAAAQDGELFFILPLRFDRPPYSARGS